MSETQAMQAIDAWAQPVTGRTRQDLPEVVRLLEFHTDDGAARHPGLMGGPVQPLHKILWQPDGERVTHLL